MDHRSFCMEMKLTFVDLSNGQKRFMCNKIDLKRFSMPLSIIQLLGLTTIKPNYFFKFPLSAFRFNLDGQCFMFIIKFVVK
jgi:hypothetical protein